MLVCVYIVLYFDNELQRGRSIYYIDYMLIYSLYIVYIYLFTSEVLYENRVEMLIQIQVTNILILFQLKWFFYTLKYFESLLINSKLPVGLASCCSFSLFGQQSSSLVIIGIKLIRCSFTEHSSCWG